MKSLPQLIWIGLFLILTACGGGGSNSGGSDSGSTGTTPVADSIAPVITIKGNNPVKVTQNSNYTDVGATANDATANDNKDGAVTVTSSGTVDTSKPGSYTITYTATDQAGNTSTKTRTVTVTPAPVVEMPDTTPPVISIKGQNPESIVQGSSYTDAGATATDDKDGAVTVKSSGSVDTSKPGSYTITYSATDRAGNTKTETRTVNVTAPQSV